MGVQRPDQPVLSIVIPAYNEERFIGTLLERLRGVDLSRFGLSKEIIVVDDHSGDRTADIAGAVPGVVVVRQARNGGKGSAVRAGLRVASGDYVVIQDADLEYDPDDYLPMLEAMTSLRVDAVYGSRYLKYPSRSKFCNLMLAKHPKQSWSAYLGGQSLSFVAWACTRRYLTDTVTALKLFRREVLASLRLESTGFELDHEITAKLLAAGRTIVEVPVRYFPRSRSEGKKIGLRDWFVGSRTFVRFRRG